ncbi:DUF6470 family protein [Evansella sp. AB-P1]|uniref:DUF6470 family protein n=1 Tax=Evansella sp. AB-P1 TaxID=3037653 RepID=UPI00241CAEEE|nr:DUF6470 family protein [Evansella sp. AB-P1]MDG5786673.1 DUF6470 family protein [Evansella sp. AB-P1]
MQLPQINIQTQTASTAIAYNRPPMSIQQRPADIHIEQELIGSFRISSTASKLYIDQTEAFADANLKTPLRLASEYTSSAQNAALQYIAKKARQGEQLKSIDNGVNAIPAIVRENSSRKPAQVELGTMPQNAFRVNIDYVPSTVEVDVDWPDPIIEVRKNDPDIHIPRWEANTYLEQKNWISFSVVGGNINKQL